MTALPLPLVLQLIGACAPTVAPTTLASVLRAESGFDPNLLHVNGAGGGDIHPATQADAIVQAIELVVVQRKSVDLGLSQLNSVNLQALGLSVAEALDPCKNLAGAAKVLSAGYRAASQAQPDPQQALRMALSAYNTGSPSRGFANGYVGKVEQAAQYVVPAIAVDGVTAPAIRPAPLSRLQPVQSETLPPSWDAFAMAAHHPISAFALASISAAAKAGWSALASEDQPASQTSPPANARPDAVAQAVAALGDSNRAPSPLLLRAAHEPVAAIPVQAACPAGAGAPAPGPSPCHRSAYIDRGFAP